MIAAGPAKSILNHLVCDARFIEVVGAKGLASR
jgi:hypothetical protein